MDPVGFLLAFAVLVVVAVAVLSGLWWIARRFGGAPMTEDELSVPTAEGGLRPSVFGGGAAGYSQPYGKMG